MISGFEPFIPMLRDKFVIGQMRVVAINPVDLFALTGAERLVRIQTPNAFQHSLPTQHFMQARDTAGVAVRGIEKRGVAVGHLHTASQPFRRDRLAGLSRTATSAMKLNRLLRPDRPMTEQPSHDAAFDGPASG